MTWIMGALLSCAMLIGLCGVLDGERVSAKEKNVRNSANDQAAKGQVAENTEEANSRSAEEYYENGGIRDFGEILRDMSTGEPAHTRREATVRYRLSWLAIPMVLLFVWWLKMLFAKD
jgi:hypothetical protein